MFFLSDFFSIFLHAHGLTKGKKEKMRETWGWFHALSSSSNPSGNPLVVVWDPAG
jgi:hypothetical protein